MKKLLLTVLVLLLSFVLFADDALVLPKSILRTTIAGSYISSDKEFDCDGNAQDIFETSLYNFGTAVEYGVNDWITAAVQWAPGYNFGSEIGDTPYTIDGSFGFFVGAKFQIVGDKAPVGSRYFRFAVAPGIVIPSSFGYDIKKSAKNAATNELLYTCVTASIEAQKIEAILPTLSEEEQAIYQELLAELKMIAQTTGVAADAIEPQDVNFPADNKTVALGARFYLDWVPNDSFFFNVYSEIMRYLPTDASNDLRARANNNIIDRLNATPVGQMLVAEEGLKKIEDVDYGWNITFAIEPHFSFPVGDVDSFNLSLPIIYNGKSECKWDDIEVGQGSYTISMNPTIGFDFFSCPLPLGFSIGFGFPCIGENAQINKVITLQVKPYLKL